MISFFGRTVQTGYVLFPNEKLNHYPLGGPGCSSLEGLLQENGVSIILPDSLATTNCQMSLAIQLDSWHG